jgi:murein L,D-transpeptidase YafK
MNIHHPIRQTSLRRLLFLPAFLLAVGSTALAQTFAETQLKHERVKTTFSEKDSILRKLCKEKDLPYPPSAIFLRVFKKDTLIELWSFSPKLKKYALLKYYSICSSSGVLGPKRQEGDLQVPEGFYYITTFNPNSSFYLSLGIDYPNASDRILGTKAKLGNAIMIHGNCVTIGCIPITNDCIKEVYWLAVLARSNGQKEIPVHILPMRLDNDGMQYLTTTFPKDTSKINFWKGLQRGYRFFDSTHTLPQIRVGKKGEYRLTSSK